MKRLCVCCVLFVFFIFPIQAKELQNSVGVTFSYAHALDRFKVLAEYGHEYGVNITRFIDDRFFIDGNISYTSLHEGWPCYDTDLFNYKFGLSYIFFNEKFQLYTGMDISFFNLLHINTVHPEDSINYQGLTPKMGMMFQISKYVYFKSQFEYNMMFAREDFNYLSFNSSFNFRF